MNNKGILSIIAELFFNVFKLLKAGYEGIKGLIANILLKMNRRLRFSMSLKISMSYSRLISSLLIYVFLIIISCFILIEGFFIFNRIPINIDENTDIYTVALDYHTQISVYDNTKALIKKTSSKDILYIPEYIYGFCRQDDRIYFAAKQVYLEDNILVTYIDITATTYELAVITIIMVALYIFIVTIVSLSGIRTNRRRLLPIYEMTESVKNISANNLNTRLNVSSSENELQELALTFNNMMNNIEESYNKQQQFVSDASHELRTPIAVIQGYISVLDRWGKENKEVLEESINAIKLESDSMKDLVEKLLFIARNDKGTLNIVKADFDAAELVNEIYKETAMIDRKHEIVLEKTVSKVINADRSTIKQALRILLDNAIKYTPEKGLITIGQYIDGMNTVFYVRDTGMGISAEELPRVFERFYRTDKSRNREKGGHGLGLAIAKIIVSRHNGKIKVLSKLGVGTEMRIIL